MLSYRRHVLSPEHEWVVFVHGAGGSSSIWYRQVREFRKHFNVSAIRSANPLLPEKSQ